LGGKQTLALKSQLQSGYSLDMSDDERAIREVVDRWMKATKAGDLAAILDLMTDDVLFMTPAGEPFGKQEFAAISEGMKDADIAGQASVQEIEVAGEWAWLRNHIDLTVTAAEGSPVHRSGDTLTILRKGDDGRWRLYRDANLVS
jgi:uncharacterized protein (TIGR02246 family)